MNRLPLIHQAGALKSYFPDSHIRQKGNYELFWKHSVKPSPLSNSYELLLHYNSNKGINMYVLKPKPLQLYKGKISLPHVYNTEKQQLCLYYPKDKEWNPSMYYVQTIIPWACEWLVHYELWLSTGVWHGGGISHENEAEKLTNQIEEQKND